MQNSALYRRGVVSPLNEVAEGRLRLNDVGFDTHVRFLSITDDMFNALWRLELFGEINARCDTGIDDYEEEWVEASQVAGVVAAIDSVADAVRDPEVTEFLMAFRSLAHEARTSSRPLLFVL